MFPQPNPNLEIRSPYPASRQNVFIYIYLKSWERRGDPDILDTTDYVKWKGFKKFDPNRSNIQIH